MYEEENYEAIDSTLRSWSKRHGVQFETSAKGYATRSYWIEGRLQLWIDAPDIEGYVRVHLAELKQELPSKWGRSINWRVSPNELDSSLDHVWLLGNQWLS